MTISGIEKTASNTVITPGPQGPHTYGELLAVTAIEMSQTNHKMIALSQAITVELDALLPQVQSIADYIKKDAIVEIRTSAIQGMEKIDAYRNQSLNRMQSSARKWSSEIDKKLDLMAQQLAEEMFRRLIHFFRRFLPAYFLILLVITLVISIPVVWGWMLMNLFYN